MPLEIITSVGSTACFCLMGVNQFWTDLIFEIFALNEIDVKHKINIAGLNYYTSSHTLNVKNDPGVYSLKMRSFFPQLFIQTTFEMLAK